MSLNYIAKLTTETTYDILISKDGEFSYVGTSSNLYIYELKNIESWTQSAVDLYKYACIFDKAIS